MIDYPQYNKLPLDYIKSKINEYLLEDAPNGDVTSLGTVDPSKISKAIIETQQAVVFSGEDIIPAFFGENAIIKMYAKDGDALEKGHIIAEIEAPAIELLTKERIILNLLQRLCGISTIARKYAEVANPYNVWILDTRKTTPGLRLFEKYAVAIGAGHNHRLDLSSGVLIKDNHIQAAGSVTNALNKIKVMNLNLPIELEVDNIDQIEEAMEIGVDGFLLDNMSPDLTVEAVNLIRHYPNGKDVFIESSGGITFEKLHKYVTTGINAISIGALTHSVKAADLHMEFVG